MPRHMEVAFFLAPWILIGIAVLYVAFTGGPGKARQTYLTGGPLAFRILMLVVYVGVGVAVPALVIAGSEEGTASVGKLQNQAPSAQLEDGKVLFRQTCASCHNLDAVNARGVVGPDLDEIGQMTPERVATAIERGGTGQSRMPAGLLSGEDAEAVAEYVAKTAGKSE
jgi:cytochrome c551/c552